MEWVFERDVMIAGVRGYICADRDEAAAMRARRQGYSAVMRVTQIGDGPAELSYMLADSAAPRITKQDFVRIARELYRHGLRRVYANRDGLLPWGEPDPDGKIYTDLAVVLGGEDGNY